MILPLRHPVTSAYKWLAFYFCLAMQTAGSAGAADCILPAYANWNTGLRPGGYNPDYQYDLLYQNHHIAPWFQLPAPGESIASSYFTKAINESKARHLPLTFLSTQWESLLSQPPYLSIKDDSNPNVLPIVGSPQKKVSPFGSEKYWYEVGMKWTTSPSLIRLQELYPDPPSVIFLSNNEHPKLQWYELETDARYLKQYSALKNLFDPETKKEITVEQWKKLYNALHQGMLDGLKNETWKKNAKFIGYLATGNGQMGKNTNWELSSLQTNTLIDPYPLFWNGGSWELYSRYNLSLIKSNPQIDAMNWIFMIKENKERNPNYYMELSVWDGHSYDNTDTRSVQEAKQPGSSLSSYVAMTKLGSWLSRPQVIREFRFYDETIAANKPYTDAIIKFVDEINDNTTLKTFWCEGELVPNRTRKHPYNNSIPARYADTDRWYLLNSSMDAQGPWTQNTSVKIWAIALKTGDAPNRKWLVYMYSTDSDIKSVDLEIPDYKKIALKPNVSGSYFLIDEAGQSAQELAPPPEPPGAIKIVH